MKKISLVTAIAVLGILASSFSNRKTTESLNLQPVLCRGAAAAEFGFFRVHRQAANAVLTWGLSSEAGVISFEVERSYDGVFFDTVSSAPCANARSYQWKDVSPFPGVIYYRIGCIMNDGTIVYSPVETVRIVVH